MVAGLLRGALQDNDLEIVRRIEKCLARIQEKDVDAEVPPAAMRLLASRRAAGALEAVLAYLPFADSGEAGDEACALLASLAKNDGQVNPALEQALVDKQPARRAAAAEALCRAGVADQQPAVRRLLADPESFVRLRVAIALVRARDKAAVPTLIGLLPQLPLTQAWQAENVLFDIAGADDPPAITVSTDDKSRPKCRDAWRAWWTEHAARVDLAKPQDKRANLGYTLLVLLDLDRIMEVDADNAIRWHVDDLAFPLDAQMVSGNRFLVAEYKGGRVTERNLRGDVLWRKDIAGPLVAQRLANGNTFIATLNGVVEFDRAGNQIFTFSMTDGEHIMKATKLPNGEVACLVDGGAIGSARIVRFDITGKELHSYFITLGMRLSGGRIYMLANGHVLIPHNAENKVIEYDVRGKAVWEVAVDQPVAAVRLANGNTLITTMVPQRGVVEYDHEGREVWSYHVNTRITRALRR